jgi:integral membrane protein (TIGR01906 family)
MTKIINSLIVKILFIFCLIVFFVSTSALFAFGEIRLYDYGFTKYHISEETGISEDNLQFTALEIIDYLVGDSNILDVQIDEQSLFNKKEIFHMTDVKALLESVNVAKLISFSFLLLYSGLILNPVSSLKDKSFVINLLSIVDFFRFSSVIALLVILVLGVALLAAFRPLFYLFHNISFRNDYWQLDPSSDYLIRLFPEGFWIDATLILTLVVLLLTTGTFIFFSILKRFVARKLLSSFDN